MYGSIEYILAGVLVGFCVGVTGVGGGSLMTPILIGLFKIEPTYCDWYRSTLCRDFQVLRLFCTCKKT